MNAKVFSFFKPTPGSRIPSGQIALWLAKQVDAELLYDDTRIAPSRGETLDVLYIVNGAFLYCPPKALEALGKAIRVARRLVWVQNDYTIIIPKPDNKATSPFRVAFRQRAQAGLPGADFWTTIKPVHKSTPASAYCNWNALTFNPLERTRRSYARKDSASQVLYYGSFRENRVRYFDRYFSEPAATTVVRTGALKKFAAHFPSPSTKLKLEPHMPQERFIEQIAKYGVGLYLEDRRSHKEFHSPANRFYEMLSAGLPMAFQPEATEQLAYANYDVTDYVVESAKELKRLMKHRREIGATQFRRWAQHVDPIAVLRKQVRRAHERLLLTLR